MSTVEKLLKKRRKEVIDADETQTSHDLPTKNTPQQTDIKKEVEYETYVQSYARNPDNAKFSHQFMPASMSVYNKTKIPMCCFTSPLYLETEPMQRSANKIPRCNYCRAYMNCYNKIGTKFYTCFFCSKQNGFINDYDPNNQSYQEITQPSYQALGSENENLPPQNAMIFIIDVSASSYHCKMLYYAVLVLKQIFAREDLNDSQIYFYTYDEVVHEYDFNGQEVKCTVLDNSILESNMNPSTNYLSQIREKLFGLLDSLQETAQHNTKTGSNFYGAFSYVYESIKHTAGRIYIFQSNETFTSQQFTQQIVKQAKVEPMQPKKSILETANKDFFNKFVSNMLNTNISCSMFIFLKNYKNIRVLTDCFKLTNSQLLLYEKDSQQDLMKFYYQLYHLLGANYYYNVRMELITVPGWYFTAVYGNLYRVKQFITFKYCHFQNSKKICCCFLPQQTGGSPPYFAMQIVTNYTFQRRHYISVNTLVVPLTCSPRKIYEGIDYQVATAGVIKSTLSSLRIEDFNSVKTKFLKQCSNIWYAALAFYNKNPSSEIRSMMLSFLGFLKCPHMQIETINNTIVLDRVIAQRNLLQSCNYLDVSTFISPYLFKLSSMTKQMCREDIEFIYPEIVQLKFSDVKEGLYLMDAGVCLYIFISRQCEPHLLKDLFGKSQIKKNESVSEEDIVPDTFFGSQVSTLIRVLREQKCYGWIPLFVIKCGQNTFNEKMFYMNFFTEKYDQFRTFKMSLTEFIQSLQHQY